ncbi:MAG: hypothetical protein N3D11_03640 [Candidatus Sumerlaeia bacterium]|nr:hypothetical protein [Candidatus Sumerlaeia bacterium]
MDTKDELFRYRTEGIIAELSNYFEIRFEQITRIKPALRSMYADLLWMQMLKVREVLGGEKMFGPIRLRVAEIFASRDEAKRHAVMGPIDQASILNELIPEQEEGGARRPGFLSVRTMRALYTSVDPALGPVIELTDIWLWWDILDAADVFNFKEGKKLIERRKSDEVTRALSDFYHQAMGRRDDRAVTREEILTFEFLYLESLWKAFMQRRAEEKSYMLIPKRDPLGGQDSVDELVLTLGRHIAARQKVMQDAGLDDRLREYYAKVLRCDPASVRAEQCRAHEDLTIMRLRDDLKMALERGVALGEPYDYKRWQGEEMGREIEHYRKTLPLVRSMLQEPPKAAPTGAASPPPPTRQAPAAETKPMAAEEESKEGAPEELFF